MKQKKKLVIGSKQRARQREKKIEEVMMHLDRKQPMVLRIQRAPGLFRQFPVFLKGKEQDDSRS